MISKTEQEIRELIDKAEELHQSGANPFWGMTYAEGISEALRWVLGEVEEDILEA